jgi:MFS family permease
MVLLSPGLALLIYGLAESASHGFGAAQAWGPTVAGVGLIAAFFVHSWRVSNPLIDLRTFVHSRAGAAAGIFLLFAIAFFGAMLLIPLYYQSVRGASALDAGLLLMPQGLGAMVTMPIGGRLTDRYGPWWWPTVGIPMLVIGIVPFAFVTATTSYVLLCAFNFVLGLGMGLSMMPTMTAAMQSVPASAIARTSTAMNIIRQGGASIGTAILTVILSGQINHRLHIHAGGFGAVQHLSPAQQAHVRAPLAAAFGSSFAWALVMLSVAFLPALAMALISRRRGAPATGAGRPLVLE